MCVGFGPTVLHLGIDSTNKITRIFNATLLVIAEHLEITLKLLYRGLVQCAGICAAPENKDAEQTTNSMFKID